jgi:hypothetical protein
LQVRFIEVEEGRKLRHGLSAERVQPARNHIAVRLVFAVAQTVGRIKLALPVVWIGIYRNLVIIRPKLSVDANLIRWGAVPDDRSEPTVPIIGVVHGLRNGWSQSVIAAIPVEACVPRELIAVAREAQLVVRLEKTARRQHQFAVANPIEPRTRHYVEHAVRPVAQRCVVAAAIDLQRLDVLGIDLRCHVGSDVGVWEGDAVDQPVELVAAAHVQHVVRHVRAGDEIRDHRQAIRLVGTRGVRDILAADEGLGRGRIDVRRIRVPFHRHRLLDRRNIELNVQRYRSLAVYRHRLLVILKSRAADRHYILAQRYRRNAKHSILVCHYVEYEVGVRRMQRHLCPADGAVLGIVDDALDGPVDGGVGGSCKAQGRDCSE